MCILKVMEHVYYPLFRYVPDWAIKDVVVFCTDEGEYGDWLQWRSLYFTRLVIGRFRTFGI